MSDLISRQDAIDALCNSFCGGHHDCEFYPECGNLEDIQAVPSAESRKKGYWILDPDGMDWNLPAWRCSLCGCKNNNIGVVAKGEGLGQNPLMWAGSKYCPNCGADMRAGEEE